MTALPSSLSTEQRVSVEALSTERVGFPRSKDDASDAYFREYRHDHYRTMRAWVAQALADFDAMYALSPEMFEDALLVAYDVVAKDLELGVGRPMHLAEQKLLFIATRDLIIVKTAKRCADELRQVAELMTPNDESAGVAAQFADRVACLLEYHAAHSFESAEQARARAIL